MAFFSKYSWFKARTHLPAGDVSKLAVMLGIAGSLYLTCVASWACTMFNAGPLMKPAWHVHCKVHSFMLVS